MKILVLDTRNGDRSADLYLLDAAERSIVKQRLGYVPEIHYDAAAQELIVVDTELREWPTRRSHRNWLRFYRADTLKPIRKVQLPDRPMYAGFPNRSARIVSTPSGRFVYTLAQQLVSNHLGDEGVFRITVLRYDRTARTLTRGFASVDSCLMEFGWNGPSEEDLYFHLTCELPSTVATARFSSPDLCLHTLEQLPPRTLSPLQTSGSWRDPDTGSLYCVTGQGTIHQLGPGPKPPQVLARLALKEPDAVPLKMLYGANGCLFVGVSRSNGERGRSLASEIRRLAIEHPAAVKTISLPFPVINFVVTQDGRTLVGVNPYDRAVCVLDAGTGEVTGMIRNVGVTPAEVLLIPSGR